MDKNYKELVTLEKVTLFEGKNGVKVLGRMMDSGNIWGIRLEDDRYFSIHNLLDLADDLAHPPQPFV